MDILDIACGAGAVGICIITTLYHLRKQGLIPKLPLDIYLTGADFSTHALDLYTEMIDSITPYANSVGINVTLKTTLWNAEQDSETAALCDNFFRRDSHDDSLVTIANFSGAANKHYQAFEDSIKHIFASTCANNCSLIWVEPGESDSPKNLYTTVFRSLANKIPWSKKPIEPPLGYHYNWYHPFQERELACHILVKDFSQG